MNVFAVLAVSVGFLGIAHAQDTSVWVTRGRRLIQTSDAAPTSPSDTTAYFLRAEALGVNFFEPIQNARFQDPKGATHALEKAGDGGYRFEQGFPTEALRVGAFPAGRYQFNATLNLLGAVAAHVDLDAAAFPPAPTLTSFAETQSVDVTTDFTLRWQPFTGIAEEDQLAMRILDPNTGDVVVEEEFIDPTTTEWTLSADSLPGDKQLAAQLIYRRIVAHSVPDPGEFLPGTSVGVSETHFTLVTHGGSTPIDTTPPSLVSTTPANGSTLEFGTTPLLFTFSEPMDQSKGTVVIEATLNNQPVALDAAKLSHIWSEDGRFLVCAYNQLGGGWPAGVTLLWRLNFNATGNQRFQDLAGNPLPSQGGQFLAAGGTDPCSSEAPGSTPGSAFGFFKQVNYRQSSSNTTITDPILGAQAFGFISLPSSTPVQTIVTLKVPTSNPFAFLLKPLTPPNGSPSLRFRVFSESFPALGELDTAYPAGTYQFELRNAQAQTTNSTPLIVLATGYPPLPRIANFAECQQINPDKPFVVKWDPFTGATTNAEFVSLQIVDDQESPVFQAPAPCRELVLNPAADQVEIPAGTLTKGKSYTGLLSFTHMSDSGKVIPSIPGSGVVGLGRIVRFPIGTGALTPPQAPVITQIQLANNDALEIRVQCTPGRLLALQKSAVLDNPNSFSTVLSTNPPTGTVTLVVQPTEGVGFFRAVHP